jgi:cytochrome d ubiquinol oxidase subunit II
MSDHTLILVCAVVTLLSLMTYVVLGGADFGGGVWDWFAFGRRAKAQRAAIADAIGPVWEANHVWLIFVIVMLFTCFSRGFAVMSEALFAPFHLALIGIMLRGAAFIFRSHGKSEAWQPVFGAASIISPFLLGSTFGAITSGAIRVDVAGRVWISPAGSIPWLSPYSVGCGFLALSTCAYLAAVYLTLETKDEVREDFRKRAIFAGTATAGLAVFVLVLAWREANWFFHALVHWDAWPVLTGGLFFFGASAWAVFKRRYRLAPFFAAGEIVLLMSGWGLAHLPYLVYPNVTLESAASPAPTLRFMVHILPIGVALILPSLWALFHVFKRPAMRHDPTQRTSVARG